MTRKGHRVPSPTPKEKSQDGRKNEEKNAEIPVIVVEEQKEKPSPPKNSSTRKKKSKKKRVEMEDELPVKTKPAEILLEKTGHAPSRPIKESTTVSIENPKKNFFKF